MNWDHIPERVGNPDFNTLLAVLRREVPSRPTLFEFYFNERLYRRIAPDFDPMDELTGLRRLIRVFHRLGYDYATMKVPGFMFADPSPGKETATFSLNTADSIRHRHDFDRYTWPDPDRARYSILDELEADLPRGMKFIPYSHFGVLENVINLMGYETLCLAIKDDPGLVEDVFAEVGERLVRYYDRLADHESVGACLANDDWGYKTSLLLSPEDLRRLVFPWYRRIVERVHAAGKPVILHSCGCLEAVSEDIIRTMRFDGRHSFEDAILPIEQAYERYAGRIAMLGGLDLDFVIRAEPDDIYRRSKDMLDRSSSKGGYALGTGNSVPENVPDANYFAMIRAVLDSR